MEYKLHAELRWHCKSNSRLIEILMQFLSKKKALSWVKMWKSKKEWKLCSEISEHRIEMIQLGKMCFQQVELMKLCSKSGLYVKVPGNPSRFTLSHTRLRKKIYYLFTSLKESRRSARNLQRFCTLCCHQSASFRACRLYNFWRIFNQSHS